MLRRFSVFTLAFLLCLSLFPARALAWDVIPKGVLYQGDVEGSNYGAVVSAYNQFDAACYVLGKDPNTISESIKQKLSDPSYGGKFYEYSQYFFTQSGALEDVPGWVPTYVVMISELGDLLLSDYQSVWYASTTKALHDAALVDFKHVLYGEDVEGGGGSGGGGDSSLPSGFELWTGGSVDSDNYLYTLVSIEGGSIEITVDMSSLSSSYGTGYHLAGANVYSGTSMRLYGFTLPDGVFAVKRVSDNRVFLYNSLSSSVSFTVFKTPVTYKGNDGKYKPRSVDTTTRYTIAGGGLIDVWNRMSMPIFAFGSAAPPPPSGVWPVAPSVSGVPAPVLPEPAEPVVETPVSPSVSAPSWPDITINIEPDPIPGTTPEGLDYTELLTRMNDNLISIDSFARAMNSNLNSLRSDLLAEFNGVIDSLRNVYNYLLTIDTVLETHCTHLRNKMEESAVFIANYMRTLIKWLADQLDFDDLTNVDSPDNSLLTTINEKLGGGTYEPNPIKDEQGYYEWLDDLWDRFLLGDNWQSSMGSISGSFSELKTRFPFSVPWDIVALFRLFVHDPVTPVFDLPLYFSPDGSTPVHVDLSPWDSVASLVRPMIFVIFALKLALLSRDLLGGLGADKGGL